MLRQYLTKRFHILEQSLQEIKVKMKVVVLRRSAIHKISEPFSIFDTDIDKHYELKALEKHQPKNKHRK